MNKLKFIKPQHINASAADIAGNQTIGRYFFLTGSDERAREISEHFHDVSINKHPRQHNLYLGTLSFNGSAIDAGVISTGMGGPSADIIINELILLGARRLLRIGTAASLQAQKVRVGDVVIATSAVRDDKASWDYIHREFPAVASTEYITAAGRAAATIPKNLLTHFGIVHSKSSLFAREYHYSLIEESKHYMNSMKLAGVLATEMECAQLFILSSLMTARFEKELSTSPAVLAGAILAIIGDDEQAFSEDKTTINETIHSAILLGIETTLQMSAIDKQLAHLFLPGDISPDPV